MTVSLVTGAGGFVGSHLCRRLSREGVEIRPFSGRARADRSDPGVLGVTESDRAAALSGVDCVYFLAGVAHGAAVGGDQGLMHRVNVEAPLAWLRSAERAGVRKFIWLSSIKVLGDTSERPLRPSDPYVPADAYARSKVEAEQRLLAEPLSTTRLAVVRPPLVYGPGVRANFLALLRLACGRLPLPLGRALAPRSLVASANLCDLLVRLGVSGSGVFHVSDGQDLSVGDLVARLRGAMGRSPGLVPLPAPAMRRILEWTGRGSAYQRLFMPLQVDQTATVSGLDWTPPASVDQAIADTVTWFRTSR